MISFKCAAAVLAVSYISGTNAYPKIGSDDKGFVPSKNYIQMKDQIAMESGGYNSTQTPSASDKSGRFGFPTYATDGQNYPQNVNNVVPGLYGPVKLDIGGLVLGTIVGLGAFFILPKLLHVISGPYGGGYKRSQDEPEAAGGLGLSEVARRVSESLESMNLDTTSCLQRAVCTSIQTPNPADALIASISKNNMVKSMLAGTEWERALSVGTRGESCGAAFTKCPFSVDSVIRPLAKYLSAS